MSLKVYQRKRNFNETPEPKGKVLKSKKGNPRFVVQMHAATRLHFDLRLEFDGVFKSWAVPKGPSLNPLDQRLAVFVEDHPLEYGSFEGIIPKGNYGAGTVMLWDEGTYLERGAENRQETEVNMKKNFEKGHLTFVLSGKKLNGEFALIKLKKSNDEKAWLLVKKRDEHSTYKRSEIPDNISVKTSRTIDEIAEESEAKGNVWLPGKKRKDSSQKLEKDPMPRKIKPMIAITSRGEVNGDDWIFEPKLDGLRAIAEVEGKRVHLYSRSGLPFEKKFPQVVDELGTLNLNAVFDGDILKSRYVISDILYCDGRDIRKEPLSYRKEVLANLIGKGKHIELISGSSKSKKHIAKNLNSKYHSGTSTDWLIVEGRTEKKRTSNIKTEEVRLTNPDKIFFPNDKITKGDVFKYYQEVSQYILPFLKDRPQSLNRHPNGIHQAGFYQKDMTGHIPKFLKTERIFSESADKTIDYVLCQNESSLLYIINLGCIEINPWFSRVGSLDNPDFLVIDLDPDGNEFHHVIEIAHQVREILLNVGVESLCKTSGATGIHIAVPTAAKYSFDDVREFAEIVCRIIAKKFPATTSVERNPSRRKKKIYLDFMQNRRGQTLAAPFCLRPRDLAPVSMPLSWKDLKSGLTPEDFTIKNAVRLIPKQVRHWSPVLEKGINLNACLKVLRKKFS
ncbi:MAG: hypothetical protein A4S09_12510 [Proteobacteria bacterium SG_bin7]|nr:MAG: hypothetical protein A4S09_12510 [Proteobacteria bacterium SG_bin7]